MRVRVPKILEEVLRLNADYAPSIRRDVQALADSIRSNAPIPPLAFPAPDEAEWAGELEDAGWLASTWFVAECYVYRCLMSAVRYWETSRAVASLTNVGCIFTCSVTRAPTVDMSASARTRSIESSRPVLSATM